ncbi:MAG: N-acetylmuramoyl-L-alanine amidase family protein [Candidatus Merdivicinus sp.]
MAKKLVWKFVSLLMAWVLLCLFTAPVLVQAADSAVMERLLLDVSPKVSTSLRSGDTLELRALAANGSEVTAKVNGNSVTLAATSEKEGTAVWYAGEYTMPSVTKETSLGNVEFTAKKSGRTETRTGGSVQVVVPSIYESVDKPEDSGSSGDLGNVEATSGDIIRITKDYADIFSTTGRGEEYASPYLYNLPKNTMDYVSSTTSSSYILKSGRRVSKSNATLVKSGTNGNNTISDLTVKNDGTFTILTLDQTWAVPFNITPSPLTYSGSGNTVTSCTPTSITITFDYTTGWNTGSIRFPSGSAFTSASWKSKMNGTIPQVELTLTLSQKGGYYGAYATYDSNGTLTLKFLNPVDSLKGARIVIDAGHGTGDPGNTGSGVNEADINIRHAEALKKELESRGAEVYLLETRGASYVDLYTRVDMATKWMPHVYIAVHQNAASSDARGVETFYNNPYSYNLAKNINDSMYQAYLTLPNASTARDRGAKFSEFAVTRVKQFAAVLVEYGFLTNAQENALLVNPANDPVFANAVADGIEEFFAAK